MRTYIVAAAAESDLLEIWRYIAEDSETAADKLLREFSVKFSLLAQQSRLGRKRPELLPAVRSFSVGRYIIFYRSIEPQHMEIIRVLHGARDLALIEFQSQRGSPN